MKLAVATPEHAPGWTLFLSDFVHPFEIRRRVAALLQQERDGSDEHRLVTMNRTVLDLVRMDGAIGYEDVVVWNGTGLVALLEIHDADWLTHFPLGDLFDHGELEVVTDE